MQKITKAILSGASTIIDLGGRAGAKRSTRAGAKRSARAGAKRSSVSVQIDYDTYKLLKDWEVVGQTIQEAMNNYGETQIQEKEKHPSTNTLTRK